MTAEPAEPADPAPDVEPGADRILTLANLVTLLRLLCLPWFLWLLFAQDDRGTAAIVLAVAGGTDFVDGYLARHFGQGSEFGKVFDPVADRLLFFVGITAIIVDGSAPGWFCVAVLTREFVVASTTVLLGVLGAPRIDVLWVGKAGTFALMMAFPSFLGSESDLGIADALEWLAWGTGIPGLVLSYIAWYQYLPLARKALAARGEPGPAAS